MNNKYIPSYDEETKYKKKSTAKGLPRSKHKHIYETVLLKRYYHHTDVKTGRPKVTCSELPTKVCTICGRVDHVDNDPSYYVHNQIQDLPWRIYSKDLSKKALSLSKWYVKDYFDKFALKGDDPGCV